MIFVTVGTARDFSRLVRKVDEIAEKSKDKFIVQKGNTFYRTKYCKSLDFVSRDDFDKYISKSDIIITHAGLGSIINAINSGKPTIVVPRRKKYNEHKNDHQMDIAKELEKDKCVLVCYDVKNLESMIKKAKKMKIKKIKSVEREKMIKTIDNFLKTI